MKTRLAFILVLFLAGCTAHPPKPDGVGRLGPVGYTLTELAQDGTQVVPVDKTFTVDPDSALELRFDAGLPATPAPADPRWVDVNAWLEATRGYAERLLELNRLQVDERDPKALNRLLDDMQDLSNLVARQTAEGRKILQRAGLTAKQIDAVEFGDFDKQPTDNIIFNVSRWIVQERAKLLAEAQEKFRREGDQVVVMAFHKVNGQARERLHVEHYDTISSGMDLALRRNALGLTERELAELRMQIEQSERAVHVIRQIQESENALKEVQKLLYEKLKAKFAELQQLLDTAGETIRKELDTALVRAKGAPLGPAAEGLRTQVEALSSGIQSLKADWEKVTRIKTSIEQARKALQATDLNTFLTGNAGLIQTLTDISDALEAVTDWPNKIENLRQQGRTLAVTLNATNLKDILSEDFKQESEKIQAAVVPIRAFFAQLQPHKNAAPPVAVLAAAGDETVPRKLDDLLPARIDLSGYKFDEHDGLTLRLELHQSTATLKTDKPKETSEYHLIVHQQGWYRRITGLPIFARASTGSDEAKQWKPNIGVTATWYYQERYPNTFGRIINAIDPGIGLHAASLNQAEESVEFGIGVNISLWKGLLTLGIGQNLSVSDNKTYYLLGSDLFRLLGTLEPGK